MNELGRTTVSLLSVNSILFPSTPPRHRKLTRISVRGSVYRIPMRFGGVGRPIAESWPKHPAAMARFERFLNRSWLSRVRFFVVGDRTCRLRTPACHRPTKFRMIPAPSVPDTLLQRAGALCRLAVEPTLTSGLMQRVLGSCSGITRPGSPAASRLRSWSGSVHDSTPRPSARPGPARRESRRWAAASRFALARRPPGDR